MFYQQGLFSVQNEGSREKNQYIKLNTNVIKKHAFYKYNKINKKKLSYLKLFM